MLDPIVKTIEVPCNQEKAFAVFVNEMGSWWPLDKRSMSLHGGGKPAKSLRIEAKQGGRIVEIAHDDTEHHWGTIKSYDPHHSISMDFHMGQPAETASLVEVRFSTLENGRRSAASPARISFPCGASARTASSGPAAGWLRKSQ